mgnify:FL=1
MEVKEHCLGMEGAMREAITLFHEARHTKVPAQQAMAEQTLEKILDQCDAGLSFSYADGLCGIGVGIEYLLQEGYVDGDANEVLSHFDALLFRIITARPAIDTSIAHGMLGIAYYLYYRLKAQSTSDAPQVLHLKEHLIYLIDWMGDALQDPAKDKNLYEFWFILVLLLQLDVFNAKILNLLNYCGKEIALWKK